MWVGERYHYTIIPVGLGIIENGTLRLLQQRHCDYCRYYIETFTVVNGVQHHPTHVS